MDSRAKLLGHPLHQMLIVFPRGLLATSVVFDIVFLATGNGRWADISFWMIASGVVGGLVAAVPGFIDWAAIPSGTRAKTVGLVHAIGNVLVLLLFAVSWARRHDSPTDPGTVEIALSLVGVALSGVTGWLGGELVNRLGIGVHPGAHADAPSTLSHRPASDSVRAHGRTNPI